MGLVTFGKDKLVYTLTVVRLILCILLDLFLVSSLPCSANMGVNGIGISNIVVNLIIFALTLALLAKNGVNVINKEKMDFRWAKDFAKIGGVSGGGSICKKYGLYDNDC